MTKIYSDLCVCCGEPKTKCTSTNQQAVDQDCLEKPSNHFECLTLEEEQEVEDASSLEFSPSCPECTTETASPCSGLVSDMPLAEDDVLLTMEMGLILQRMAQLFEEVRTVWTQVSHGRETFVAASFVTNVAAASMKWLESRMRELDGNVDLEYLQKICSTLHSDGDEASSTWIHSIIGELTTARTAVSHATGSHQSITPKPSRQHPQTLCEYVRSAGWHQEAGSSSMLEVLIDNMMRLVQEGIDVCSVVRNGTPLYDDLDHVLQDADNKSAKLRLILGLTVLSESNVDYIGAAQPPVNPPSCRLVALRFAQQAAKAVNQVLQDKTCFPCQCIQTIAFHLQNLETELLNYASYKCWDLFFQSPWVAGNHVLEMLDMCQYYGTKLFSYRHYVGSVLHSYNVLQQLAGLEEISLFEWLCHNYQNTFFPGGRPTSNFRACWSRYIGARLRFKKGHKSHNHRDSWCMAIPAHAAQKAAGLGITRDGKDNKDECLLFRIKQQDYVTEDLGWSTVETKPSRQFGASKLSRSGSDIGQSQQHRQLSVLLQHTKTLLSSSRDSVMPAARLNHFAVFATCVRIIATLSDATHTDAKDKGTNCICFANAILNGGDRIVQARKLGRTGASCWTKDEREGVVKMTTEAMKESVQRRWPQDWMWSL